MRKWIALLPLLALGCGGERTDTAVDGPRGVTDDTILAFFFREERAARSYDGPDEVHRMAVARRLVKPLLGASRP